VNPSEKPPVFLTAEWRSLVMINYAVDPAALAPHVPSSVELDLWEGEALVSMVGFLFLKTRLLGLPIPFHQNFEEVCAFMSGGKARASGGAGWCLSAKSCPGSPSRRWRGPFIMSRIFPCRCATVFRR
jgi:hypothetical protein